MSDALAMAEPAATIATMAFGNEPATALSMAETREYPARQGWQ